MTSSRIVSLTAENVKRLIAVHIEPGDDGCVLIGGKNAAGKSSVLDSIMYALGGASSLPDEPIRHGKEAAEIVVDLGDIIVRRKFTKAGSTVTVKTVDGASYSSPQKVLDGLFSKLSFDPLAFASMKPADQSKALIVLLGIDTSALDEENARLYEERTGVNRLIKEAEADLVRCEEILIPVPESRPDVGEIANRLSSAIEASAASDRRRISIQSVQAEFEECQAEHAVLTAKVAVLDQDFHADMAIEKSQMETARVDMAQRQERETAELVSSHLSEANSFIGRWEDQRNHRLRLLTEDRGRNTKQITNLQDAMSRQSITLAEVDIESAVPDVDAIRQELAAAEEGVHAWDVARDKKDKATRLALCQEEADELTDQMELITYKKREKLAEANYPIAGLAVNEDGTVLFDGVPLSQASHAQQIRTSVAIGIAMNPKLKVLLIRDGSLLDEENMQLVADMAKQHDAQIWIERVGDKDASAIVIEDGHVRGVDPAAEEPAAESKPKKTRKKAAEQTA